MTWTAAIMPDDALDPDSLVGRMLRPTVKESLTVEKTVEKPLPLWQAMYRAYDDSYPAEIGRSWEDTDGYAAEIEALRDWLVPDEPEPPSSPHMGSWVNNALWRQRDHLRARLTEQARIARKGE